MKNNMLRIKTAVLLLLFCYTATAERGGVSGAVHHSATEGIPYRAHIGNIAKEGFCLIGVVRRCSGTQMLLCSLRNDTVVSAVTSRWMGRNENRSAFSGKTDTQDSLVIYNYSMCVPLTDMKRTDAVVLIGRGLTSSYAASLGVSAGDKEAFKEYSVYGNKLNMKDNRKVESYYAIKYGITLDQTNATDYLNSNGDVVWDGNESKKFRYDIAGLGVDSGSELNHYKASGISTGRNPEITSQTEMKNGTYLMWGHDNGPMAIGDNGRIERVWETTSTGDWSEQPVSISFSIDGDRGLPKPEQGMTYALSVGSSPEIEDATYKSRYSDTARIVFDDVILSGRHEYVRLSAVPLTKSEKDSPLQYVNVYPSPSIDGNITVEVGLYCKNDIQIIIYNSVGQTIASKKMTGEKIYKYDGFLPVSGVYEVMVMVESDKSVTKVTRR